VTGIIKNAKKGSFSKLFSGFHFWTFLKMSKFHFPFDFMEKSCDCDGENKKRENYVSIFGHTFSYILKCHFFSSK
jgi:hypothetical protein